MVDDGWWMVDGGRLTGVTGLGLTIEISLERDPQSSSLTRPLASNLQTRGKSHADAHGLPKDASVAAIESDKSRTTTRGKGALQSRPTPVTTLCCDTTTSDMEVSPNTEGSTGGVAGFVRNTSVGEEEMEAFNAPEVAVDEERKLREERERREEDLASKVGTEVAEGKDVVLEEGKYAQVRVWFLLLMVWLLMAGVGPLAGPLGVLLTSSLNRLPYIYIYMLLTRLVKSCIAAG